MRNTGPVKFENDLRKKLLSRFQKMKKLLVPFSKQEKSCAEGETRTRNPWITNPVL